MHNSDGWIVGWIFGWSAGAAINARLSRDLFVALGEPLENGDWAVRIQYKPFIRFIWLGFLIFVGQCGECQGNWVLKVEVRFFWEPPPCTFFSPSCAGASPRRAPRVSRGKSTLCQMRIYIRTVTKRGRYIHSIILCSEHNLSIQIV